MFLVTDYQQNFKGRRAYLTAGKLYRVVAKYVDDDLYTIFDDQEYPITVRVGRASSHLNDVGAFTLCANVNPELFDKALIQKLSDKGLIQKLLDALEDDWIFEKVLDL